MLKEKLKNDFITGIILVTPLILTVLLVNIFLDWTSFLVNPILEVTKLGSFTDNNIFVARILVLVLGAFTVLSLGGVARTRIGSKFLGGFSRVVHLIPLLRTIYFNFKHFADSLTDKESKYKEAVLVEYPEAGTYRLGFLTASTPAKISQNVDKNLQNVFMPNSPNPIGGMLVMISEDKIYEVEMSIKEALRTIMTTGIKKEDADDLMDKNTERNT